MRAVLIVLLEIPSDALSRLGQAAIFRSPDFFFLQAAVEPLDVAVALRMIVGRAWCVMPGCASGSMNREDVNCGQLLAVSVRRESGFSTFRWQPIERCLFHGSEPFLDSATVGEILSDDLAGAAVDHAHKIKPSHRRPGPDLRHVRLPDLIRFGCFHASLLFLPSCSQTVCGYRRSNMFPAPIQLSPNH
jgi:hypothetical protein